MDLGHGAGNKIFSDINSPLPPYLIDGNKAKNMSPLTRVDIFNFVPYVCVFDFVIIFFLMINLFAF